METKAEERVITIYKLVMYLVPENVFLNATPQRIKTHNNNPFSVVISGMKIKKSKKKILACMPIFVLMAVVIMS